MRVVRMLFGWGFSLAAVAGIALAGATSFGTKCYDASLMASWVQAVGAIAAIIWAGKFASDQLLEQRRLQEAAIKATAKQRLESVIALCEVAVQEIGNAERFSDAADRMILYACTFYEPKTFEGLISALAAFPIHELPGAQSVGTAQRFRDGLMHADKAVAAWVTAIKATSRSIPDAAAYMAETFDYLRSQLKALKRQLAEYSAS